MMVYVGLCGTCGGQEEVVLRNDIGLSQGKLPVEDFEEFPFYAADVASSKHSGPRRPMDILRRCIVDILNGQSISIGKKKPENQPTLVATTNAPRKMRSHAHCSNSMNRCGLARSMYTRATRMTGSDTRDFRMTSVTNSAKFMRRGDRGLLRPLISEEHPRPIA